jgi:hypothetical protein
LAKFLKPKNLYVLDVKKKGKHAQQRDELLVFSSKIRFSFNPATSQF